MPCLNGLDIILLVGLFNRQKSIILLQSSEKILRTASGLTMFYRTSNSLKVACATFQLAN